MPDPIWKIAPGRAVELDRPRAMAILNVTPDSFSDGGRFGSVGAVVAAARRAIDDGADLLDIGGESTRPGAQRIPVDEQISRVVPAVAAIRGTGIVAPISVDTTRAAVAEAALDAGADIINDVSGGLEDDALHPLVAQRGCGLILMHRLAPPGDDSYSDRYKSDPDYGGDVVASVRAFLSDQLDAAISHGVDPASVVLDPGLGFGKSVEQNLELIAQTGELLELGRPILSAASRKSFIGRVSLGRDSDPGERLAGSLAATVLHLKTGARLFRVHDVAQQAGALRLAWAITGSKERDVGIGTRNTGGADRIGSPATRVARASEIHQSPRRDTHMAGANVKEFTDGNFEAEVVNSDVPVLVDFWAEWCMPCKMLAPTIDEVADEFAGKAKVGKVDTDSNRNISVKYGISAIPTVMLFKDGEIINRFVGLTKKDELAAAITQAAG